MVKFLQADLQGPFLCCHVVKFRQKNTLIIIILYHLKKCCKFELFLFLPVLQKKRKKLMKENKKYLNFQHEILGN
jgi:hypothetical protein